MRKKRENEFVDDIKSKVCETTIKNRMMQIKGSYQNRMFVKFMGCLSLSFGHILIILTF